MRSIASPSALRSLASTRTISDARPDSSSANANVEPDGAGADDGDTGRVRRRERVGPSGGVMAEPYPTGGSTCTRRPGAQRARVSRRRSSLARATARRCSGGRELAPRRTARGRSPPPAGRARARRVPPLRSRAACSAGVSPRLAPERRVRLEVRRAAPGRPRRRPSARRRRANRPRRRGRARPSPDSPRSISRVSGTSGSLVVRPPKPQPCEHEHGDDRDAEDDRRARRARRASPRAVAGSVGTPPAGAGRGRGRVARREELEQGCQRRRCATTLRSRIPKRAGRSRRRSRRRAAASGSRRGPSR